MKKGIALKWLNQNGRMGNFIVICAPPHKGKTNLLINLIDKCLIDDFEVIGTNRVIEFQDNPNYHYITNIIELLQAYIKTNKPSILAFDDALTILDATTKASTKKSRSLLDLYTHIAKIQGNLIFVAHERNKIPTTIREYGPLEITITELNKERNYGVFEINNRKFYFYKSQYNIMKAQFSGFDILDFPLNSLYNELSRIKGRSNQDTIKKNKKLIKRFIDDYLTNKIAIPTKKQIEVVLRVFDSDMGKNVRLTQKYIAEKFKVERQYVNNIKRNMKF